MFFCTVRSTPHQSIFWHWLFFYSPCRTLFKLVFFWWVLSCDERHCIEVQWSAMNAWEKKAWFFFLTKKERRRRRKKEVCINAPKRVKGKKKTHTHARVLFSPSFFFSPYVITRPFSAGGVRDELARGVCQKRGGNLTPPIHVRLCGSTIRWATNSTSLKSNNQGNLGSEWSLPISNDFISFLFF